MIKSKALLALFLVGSLFSFPAAAEDSEEASSFARELLVVGKMSGSCGILRLQVQYQENTGLEGGDVFLTRFWSAEAARLGMTLDELIQQCQVATKSYQQHYEMFNPQHED